MKRDLITDAAIEFTRLSIEAQREMGQFFDTMRSQVEVMKLISEFRALPADGKSEAEYAIVKILSACNTLTGYYDEHGKKLLCKNRRDAAEVEDAAKEYERYAGKLPTESDFEKAVYEKLLEIYGSYKSSGDYIDRLVRKRMNVLNPDLIGAHDTTRLLIFKQFLKAVEFPESNYISRNLKNYILGTMKDDVEIDISKIQDSIFSVLGEIQITKDNRDQWAPLMWADDIANGIFDNQRTTRNKLYWFAIIFQMSFYTGDINEIMDEDTDIQKNLFYEYYSDNLINNLINADMHIESEPTGHGINYKNFMEVIYLYYIHQPDMSPLEKLTRSKKMIEKCKTTNAASIQAQTLHHAGKSTVLYESLISRIMGYSEKDLHEFISANYICGHQNANAIRAASGNITAAGLYKKLFDELHFALSESTDLSFYTSRKIDRIMCASYYEEKCGRCKRSSEGKYYTECPLYESECSDAYLEYSRGADSETLAARKQMAMDKIIKKHALPMLRAASELIELPDEDAVSELAANGRIDELKSVMKILAGIKSKFIFIHKKATIKQCMESMFMPAVKPTETMQEKLANHVTRTKMIILYYYTFIIQQAVEQNEFESFEDFYNHFCFEPGPLVIDGYEGLDDILIDAGYQGINPKNIFDSIIVFFAYKNYNKIKEEFRNIDRGNELL